MVQRRITVDCRFGATRAGLGRFTRSMLAALLRRTDDITYVLLVRDASEPWLASLPSSGAYEVRVADVAHYGLAEHIMLRRAILAAHADLHLSMHFILPAICPVPSVITVHDLILHRYPNGAPLLRRLAYRALMRRAISQSSHILVPSTAVADDVRATYGERARHRTVVTGEGVDDAYVPQSRPIIDAVLQRHALQQPFFLYVGGAKQHKNVETLVGAHAQLPLSAPPLVLVVGGREAKALQESKRVRILRDVADADLPALYSAAACCVTASLDEGFCLPIAEAIACGCPVIASNRGAIPETAKGHAVLVEPTVEALAGAMASLPPRPTAQRLWSWDDAAAIAARTLHEAMQH
jgi:alpha-1,3-rhamnosyl/mannosyltransferase